MLGKEFFTVKVNSIKNELWQSRTAFSKNSFNKTRGSPALKD